MDRVRQVPHDYSLNRPPRFLVQAKATQALNVTRVLGGLRTTLKKEPY